MRPRSLPVLEPDIGLKLPQATHTSLAFSHIFCFAYSRAYFRLVLRFARRACAVICVSKLTSFAPQSRDGTLTRGVLDCQTKTDGARKEDHLALQDKAVRVIRRCSTI